MIVSSMDVIHYVDRRGRDLFQDWLVGLHDATGKKAVVRRISRLMAGNFGDHKFCRDGVWELRIDIGPGYRVYYGLKSAAVVLLLCGGDKGGQDRDIARAVEYWRGWSGG
jgi:putative addiction module killer protein